MPVSVAKLDRKHAEWTRYAEAWRRICILNAGGIDLKNALGDFLSSRPKEPGDVYSERVNQGFAQPLLGSISGWWISKLFQRAPQIERTGGADDFWSPWMDDVDRAKTSLNDLGRQLALDWILYGRSYWLTDKPRPIHPVESRGDEIAQGLHRPYLTRFDPTQVINWADDEFGNLKWAVVKARQEIQEDPLGDCETFDVWYVFDQQTYSIYQAKVDEDDAGVGADERPVELVDKRPHALAAKGRCPLRRLSVDPSLWMANRAYTLLCEFLNQENTYGWSLKLANLAMPVIISPDNLETLALSEFSFLHLKEGSVSWLEPSGNSFKFSADRVESLRVEVFRSFHSEAQGRPLNATSQVQSGFSKQLDMQPSSDVMNHFGDVEIRGMQALAGDVADARNEKVDVSITGFRFESRTALQDIEEAQASKDLGVFGYSETAERELIKRVTLAVLDDSTQTVKDAAMKEIEAAPTADERAQEDLEKQQAGFENSFTKARNSAFTKDAAAALAA